MFLEADTHSKDEAAHEARVVSLASEESVIVPSGDVIGVDAGLNKLSADDEGVEYLEVNLPAGCSECRYALH